MSHKGSHRRPCVRYPWRFGQGPVPNVVSLVTPRPVPSGPQEPPVRVSTGSVSPGLLDGAVYPEETGRWEYGEVP